MVLCSSESSCYLFFLFIGVSNVVVGKGSFEVNQSMGSQLVFQPSSMCRDENGVEVSAFPEKKWKW